MQDATALTSSIVRNRAPRPSEGHFDYCQSTRALPAARPASGFPVTFLQLSAERRFKHLPKEDICTGVNSECELRGKNFRIPECP